MTINARVDLIKMTAKVCEIDGKVFKDDSGQWKISSRPRKSVSNWQKHPQKKRNNTVMKQFPVLFVIKRFYIRGP